MKKSVALSFLLSAVLVTAAQAQATRTWVSGIGNDANPCSRTAPCKTFAGAISKTALGGEIDTLDPGGFGAVTITKAITLDGTQNGLAGGSVLVSGTPGIIVNAPGAVVTIRGLSFNGVGLGTVGISVIQAGTVHVEGCVIHEFNGRGIAVTNSSGALKLLVRDTVIRNNTGDGITTIPSGTGTVGVVLESVRADQNGQAGFQANNNTKAAIFNSSFSFNSQGVLVTASSNSVDIASSTMTNNATGLFNGLSGGTPTTHISQCLIANNTTAGITNAGTVIGFSNNAIVDNPGGNTVSTSVLGQ